MKNEQFRCFLCFMRFLEFFNEPLQFCNFGVLAEIENIHLMQTNYSKRFFVPVDLATDLAFKLPYLNREHHTL